MESSQYSAVECRSIIKLMAGAAFFFDRESKLVIKEVRKRVFAEEAIGNYASARFLFLFQIALRRKYPLVRHFQSK
jgi:predicted RNase H-related nuclease YkuK (DUF458 family)